MQIVSSYRARAIGFEALARRTRDTDIKQQLFELSLAYMAVADAIERNPGLAEIEEFATWH